jgi:endonuclease YncB( thermonuclease family)
MTRKQSIFSVLFLFAAMSIGAIFFLRTMPEWHISSFLMQWKSNFLESHVNDAETFFVHRVVDGDTIELENGEKVRYIGINTPESVDPRQGVECFGRDASEYNRELVEGKKVRLEKDISERDKYGRLLRFVYLENGTSVNEKLVREGYAYASAYPPDITKQTIFREAERQARNEKVGLWNENTCHGKK